jgi:ACS family hexuronate transporter-like MFS transporter
MSTVTVETVGKRISSYRWVICGLLFFATTVNYVDRQVLGINSKDLKIAIGWNEVDYGNIVAAFNAAYAFGLLLAGRLMDRIGTRAGYALAIVWWSLAAMAHALARTPFGFGVARAALGVGEAGNFPAAIKTVAEWFRMFVGWCAGLLSHVTGQTLFEYMMLGAAIGIPAGITIGSLSIHKKANI